MPTVSREYVSRLGCGDFAHCVQVRDAVVAEIRKLNSNGRVANFYARVIENQEGLEDEDIDIPTATGVTGGRFPLLWINITYDPDRLEMDRLSAIEKQFDLVLTGTAYSRLSLIE